MPGHLTAEERDRIAQMVHQGAFQKEIATALGRSESTISRELRRNGRDDGYHACGAQAVAERRRSDRPLERRLDDPELADFVRNGLARNWSPEQITGRLKSQFPDQPDRWASAPTIYDWIRASAN